MKREVLAWLLFAIFFLLLSLSSATPKQKQIIRAAQLEDLYQSKRGDEERRVTGLTRELPVRMISKKGARGVYGGGDLLHPRTKKRNGAKHLFFEPSSILSAILRHVVVGLLLLGVFF